MTPFDFVGANIDFDEPKSSQIETSTTEAVPFSQNRKWILVCNDSDEVMYLSWGNPAEMNKGIRLNPNGSTIEFTGPYIFSSSLNAICESGGKNFTYQESS